MTVVSVSALCKLPGPFVIGRFPREFNQGFETQLPGKPAFPPFKALQMIKDDVEDPLAWETFEKFVGLLR
jgi:hypothetical protein